MQRKNMSCFFILYILWVFLGVHPSAAFAGNSDQDQKFKDLTPTEGHALVYIFRTNDPYTPNELFIDEKFVDQVSKGGFIAVELPSGPHQIKIFDEDAKEKGDIALRNFVPGKTYYLNVDVIDQAVYSHYSDRVVSIFFVKPEKGARRLANCKFAGAYRLDSSETKRSRNIVKFVDISPTIGIESSTKKVAAAPEPPQKASRRPSAAKGSTFPNLVAKLPENQKTNRHAVAVIVGNRNYSTEGKGVPDVDFALNDADAIYQYLTATLGYRDGNIIVLKDATQADLVSAFGIQGNPRGKLYDWIRPGKSDVFVYYSGHGAPGLSDGQGYLLPVNVDPVKLELNGYPLKTLYANLAQLPAKSITVLLDACFSGSSAQGTIVKNASSIALRVVEPKTQIPGATVLAAAGLAEVASWDEQATMGLFTRHFLRGVSGAADGEDFGNRDGRVTLGELKSYLEDEVTYNARRIYGRDQHPQVSGNEGMVMAVLEPTGNALD